MLEEIPLEFCAFKWWFMDNLTDDAAIEHGTCWGGFIYSILGYPDKEFPPNRCDMINIHFKCKDCDGWIIAEEITNAFYDSLKRKYHPLAVEIKAKAPIEIPMHLIMELNGRLKQEKDGSYSEEICNGIMPRCGLIPKKHIPLSPERQAERARKLRKFIDE
jgi:hypothetical protein